MDRTTGAPLAGADHLRQSIADILGTPLGTRLARRDYGSTLPELLDQPMNDLGRMRVLAAAALALLRQEDRIRISRIAFTAGAWLGAYTLTITGRRTDAPAPAATVSLSVPVRAASALSV
ncbi:GPW/gp25 family protein [Sphingomonas sp. Leaf38]|uniref:GPW/gp25 family protein n=1 Tax=Sphingomonas sp. Leaf38 TaxID=1736217 RepID=UPI000A596422|nr:GPW/gp25 family protein [Sphingomonas sp. Leaf38]